jgi:hypothetical protein
MVLYLESLEGTVVVTNYAVGTAVIEGKAQRQRAGVRLQYRGVGEAASFV